jgi:hypothetical protein
MNDEELKLQEIETSHTLGGSVTLWVEITDTPVYIR